VVDPRLPARNILIERHHFRHMLCASARSLRKVGRRLAFLSHHADRRANIHGKSPAHLGTGQILGDCAPIHGRLPGQIWIKGLERRIRQHRVCQGNRQRFALHRRTLIPWIHFFARSLSWKALGHRPFPASRGCRCPHLHSGNHPVAGIAQEMKRLFSLSTARGDSRTRSQTTEHPRAIFVEPVIRRFPTDIKPVLGVFNHQSGSSVAYCPAPPKRL